VCCGPPSGPLSRSLGCRPPSLQLHSANGSPRSFAAVAASSRCFLPASTAAFTAAAASAAAAASSVVKVAQSSAESGMSVLARRLNLVRRSALLQAHGGGAIPRLAYRKANVLSPFQVNHSWNLPGESKVRGGEVQHCGKVLCCTSDVAKVVCCV
jgi:hypothetical protein